MKTLFNSRQNEGIPPTPTALLIMLLFSPAMGNTQALYPNAGQSHGTGADMTNIVSQLEYNALLALLGAVVLMGIIYICHVSKVCADLNQPQKNIRSLLILVAGLGAFCSSCSAEQQALAAQYQPREEYRSCPLNHQDTGQTDSAFNNRYPSIGYSNWYGPAYCKYCGRRVSNSPH